MGNSSRICSYCQTPNKGDHRYCVRCSAPLDPASYGRPVPRAAKRRPSSARRYIVAAAIVFAAAAGFMLHAVVRATHEVPALTEDVHADNPPAAVVPPPAVSGWTPGGSAAPAPEATAAPAWSSSNFPVARPMPIEPPSDPSTSMVGIAPRAPRARAAVTRQKTFTNDDLVETRDSNWTAPAAETPTAPRSEEVSERETKLREKLASVQAAERRLSQAPTEDREDARDDLEDARHDAEKAARKLEDARRQN
jgi:hypothetical protein